MIESRTEPIQAAVEAWHPGARVLYSEPLKGGMSAELWRVDGMEADGTSFRVVARFPGPESRARDADSSEYELRTLEAVTAVGIQAPKPLGIGRCSDGHFLLLEYLEGRATAAASDPRQYVRAFASALAAIHQVEVGAHDFSFLQRTRRQFENRRSEFNNELREGEITDRLVAAGPQVEGEDVLRHGDFWPGNILWQNGELTGVIDWENALLGPAIADLAISRLDIFWVFGRDTMEEFTARYLELNPISTSALPYWDLRASLRPMANLPEWAGPYVALDRPDVTPEGMRRVLVEFVDQAETGMRP